MAEEFHAAAAICGDNYWWNNNINNNNYSGRSMFPLMMGSTCSVAANNDAAAAAGGNYSTWQSDFMDLKPTTRSCSAAAEEVPNINFATSLPFLDAHSNTIKHQQSEESADGSILIDSTLHMMGFGLSSSPSSNWNNNNHHSLFRCNNGRPENNFHSVLQEETGTIDSCNHTHQIHSSSSSSVGQVSSVGADFKPVMNQQEFPIINEQSMMSSVTSTTGLSASGSYGYPSSLMQAGLYETEPATTQNNASPVFSNPACMSSYSSSASATNYGTCSSSELSAPTWCTTVVSSMMKPPQQQQQQQQQQLSNNGLHFSNNTPFWNASADALHDIRATVFSSSSSSSQPQPQYQSQTFDDKSNCPSASLSNKQKREESPEKASSAANKSGSEAAAAAAFKRPRIETPSPLPTFKVRKEKLGDRITALQQLVSPFGKTDTASVLHEAIEYIKFLHDQVNVLSTPYMKNGTPIPHQQGGCENMKESSSSLSEEGGKRELRRRGLCLVPISNTFPMATETTADFWTPTFGGGPLFGARQ